MTEVAKAHCLDVTLVQMIGAIMDEGDDMGYGLCGNDLRHEGVVYKGSNEWRAYHHQPNAALHEAICAYVRDRKKRSKAKELSA